MRHMLVYVSIKTFYKLQIKDIKNVEFISGETNNGNIFKQDHQTSSHTSYEELRAHNRDAYNQKISEYNRRVAATDSQGAPGGSSTGLYQQGTTGAQRTPDQKPETSKRKYISDYLY